MTTNTGTATKPARRSRILRLGLWVADGALLGLLVAANLASYVPPETLWWLQLVAVFNGLLLVLVALIGIGAALRQRWALAGVHTALCLFTVLMPTLRPRPDAAPVPPEVPGLTVLTFNASLQYAGRQEDTFGELLASERPHLVVLQEFPVVLRRETGITMGAPLLIPLLKNRAYEASWPRGGHDFMFSRPIFSRIGTAGPGELLAGDPPEGLWSSGGITRRRYRWLGRTISVYDVHLHSFSSQRPWREPDERFSLRAWGEAFHAYGHDFEVRAEQARWLRQVLEAEEHPFLVCGDLNSTPRSWVYAHLARGLRDAFQEAGTGWGGTFPARFPAVRIDYVLASPDWEVRRAHVDADLFSDHRPVIAELALRPQPGR